MIKQEIKNLRKEGYSYREICRKLNTSYGTVERSCQGVKISEAGLKRLSSLIGVLKQIKFKEGLSEAKVRIMSNLLFDGAVYISNGYHYSIMYVNSSDELIRQFIDDVKQVYGITPFLEVQPTYKRVNYNSKIIYNDLMKYFKSYSTSSNLCEIPNEIINGTKAFKIIILRAFWENEGSISKSGQLAADLKSLKVIRQLSKLHNEFGLKHNICRYKDNGWMYKLFLSKTSANYKRFVGFELFSKANVSKGYFIGIKKADVLNSFLAHRLFIDYANFYRYKPKEKNKKSIVSPR